LSQSKKRISQQKPFSKGFYQKMESFGPIKKGIINLGQKKMGQKGKPPPLEWFGESQKLVPKILWNKPQLLLRFWKNPGPNPNNPFFLLVSS